LFGNGDGIFKPGSLLSLPYGIDSLVIADVNGDGNADILLTPYDSGTNTANSVSIILGNGDGTFRPYTVLPTIARKGLAVADLNQDGKADLVVSGNYYPNAEVGVYLATAMAPLEPATTFSTPTSDSVTIADIDNDQRADLVVGAMDIRHRSSLATATEPFQYAARLSFWFFR